MRHPASSLLPCDPNRESPPSLITCKEELLPLGSHCNTRTLPLDNALKSRKNFFAKTYLRVLKHEENLFWKKVEKFFDRKFLASIGTLVSEWDTQPPAPCHAIRTGRVPLLWLHAKGSFCLWDLIAIPGLWLVTMHLKVGKNFFAKTYLRVLKHEENLLWKKVEKFFDRKFLASIGTLVSEWVTQPPAPCHAIRTGRVPLLWLHAKGSFCLWDLIAIPGLWLVTMHLKVGKIFFAKTYLRVLKHEENLLWKKVEKFFDRKFLASIGTLVSEWDTQPPAPCHAIRTGRVPLLWLHAKGSFCLWDLIAIPGLWLVTMHLKVGKIFFAKTYLRVLKHEENLFWKKVEKFFDRKFLDSIGTLVSEWDTQPPAPCHAIRTGRVPLLWLHAKGSFCLWDLIAIPGLWLVTMHLKVGKIFFAKTYLRVLKHEENLLWKKVEKFFDRKFLASIGTLVSEWDTQPPAPCHAIRTGRVPLLWLRAKGSFRLWDLIAIPGLWLVTMHLKVGKLFFAKTNLRVLKHEENLFWTKLKIFYIFISYIYKLYL